jgi:hypothetical protein
MKKTSTELNRVRKLLSLFDGTKDTNEGKNAREAADKILIKHGWKESEVRDAIEIVLDNDADEWRKMLVLVCAERFGTEILEDKEHIYVQGLSAAVDDAMKMFKRLDKKIAEEADEFVSDLADDGRERVLYLGFAMNAVISLFERVVNLAAHRNIERQNNIDRMNYEMSNENGTENNALVKRIEDAMDHTVESLSEDELEFCAEGQLLGQRLPLTDFLTRTIAGMLPLKEEK